MWGGRLACDVNHVRTRVFEKRDPSFADVKAEDSSCTKIRLNVVVSYTSRERVLYLSVEKKEVN